MKRVTPLIVSTMEQLQAENAQLRNRTRFGDYIVLGTCIAVAIAFVMGWL